MNDPSPAVNPPISSRPELEDLHPYEPGKPAEEIRREYNLSEPPVKLASNENPYGPPDLLQSVYEECFEELNRYPDGGCYALKTALADRYGWPREGIAVGAGSDEILDCFAKAFLRSGDEIITGDPAFARYPMGATMMGAETVTVPLTESYDIDVEAMTAQISENTRFICLPNPNNPTARYIPEEQLVRLLDQVPDHALMLLDEAYFELIDEPDYPDGFRLLQESEGSNLVVLRTFSKAYGLAGLRVGYGLMAPGLVRELDKVRPPFNVNRPAQATAHAVLRADLDEYLRDCRERIRRQRSRLVEELRRLEFEVVPPQANFMLVGMRPEIDAGELCEQLLRRGVIVRPMGGYGLDQHIRLTVGTPRQNDRFLTALEDICGD